MLLRSTTAAVLAAAGRAGLPALEKFQVTETPDPALGDVATNYPLAATKEAKRTPMGIAEALAAELRKDPTYAEVTVAAPGFVNLRLAPSAVDAALAQLASQPFDAPTKELRAGTTVLVEAGAENIAKPMGVGHLRSNIIGMACARLWRTLGADVVVVNHLGDWGTQFGKLIVAVRRWGDLAVIRERGIPELVALYQRFTQEAKEDPALDEEGRAVFLALEQGDPEVRALWEEFVTLSLKEYRTMYERLGVVHDHVLGESFYEDKMDVILEELLTKKVATENADGSIGIEFPKKALPSTIVRKSNGSTVYLTRDLAALKYRHERFHPNLHCYFVGAEQSLHFQQVFRTAELLGWDFHAVHAPHGLVLAEHGKKMSTREGTAVTIEALFERAEDTARAVVAERTEVPADEQDRLARDLATAAIMYNDLSQNRTTAIIFDWEKMLAFEGDTAPYLLYAVARANSLEAKAATAGLGVAAIHIEDPKEAALARELLLLHDRILLAADTLKPNMLAEQLFRIAQAFSSFYADVPVLTAAPDVAGSRLALALLTRDMLRGGLDVLGIPRVNKM